MVPTLIGMMFDKFSKRGGGHVVALLSAAMISNLSNILKQEVPKVFRVPIEHVLYDWCWTIFLPASLVFALLSSSTSNVQLEDSESQPPSFTDSHVTRKCLQGMAIPFLIGSIGSLLGGVLSFFSVAMPSSSASSVKYTTNAILAGCLSASYIGGTINFFAAGKILTPLSNSNDMGNLFASMAAADLVVMALYFTMLSTVSKSRWLKQFFPSRESAELTAGKESSIITETDPWVASNSPNASLLSKIFAISLAIFSAFSSVFLATQLENTISNKFKIPGTMCAFLAMFGLLYDKLIRFGTYAFKSIPAMEMTFKEIPVVAPGLSNLAFFLLFAAVGTTADVTSAVLGGPMALFFAMLALTVHSVVLLSGTLVWSRVVSTHKSDHVLPTWQEVLTASNAAIGGPSTAATFAAGLVPSNNGSYRRALVLSASIYGVLGYAVGTSAGVSLTKLLLRWVT